MIEIINELYTIEENFFVEKLEKIVSELKLEGAITVKIGDEEESLHLNKEYRKRDYPADVLSFSFNEDLPDGFYLGDVFVCYPIAVAQAKENNISLEEELFTLMVHGILHLAGHDHETDSGEMLLKQDELIKAYFQPKK